MGQANEIVEDAMVLTQLLDPGTSEKAIIYLYRTYFEGLGRFVVNNNGSQEDAEDIFQEVIVSFVHLVRQQKFRGESSIRTFLFSMNRNTWLNELKRRGRKVTREKNYHLLQDQKDERIEKVIEQREDTAQLLKLMEVLGDTCKKLLLLFYFENCSMKEILEKLEYENEQVVRNKKYKCLKKLEEMIASNKGLYHKLKNLLHG
jgi:RNA polymerase sigma factor (sigma-70 family)